MAELLVLVDENDVQTGVGEKMDIHQKGLLHRAFSIFVFNSNKELLLQQRSMDKYHSAGLWTNTCCSHPGPGEDILTAAHRRLQEEMGFNCDLTDVFNFIYRAEFDNGLIESELDHVIIGYYNRNPIVNPEEVMNYKWVNTSWLQRDIEENSKKYTEWLKISFEKVLPFLK
jgi:isopentenyl-diphosphate delta-isomerase